MRILRLKSGLVKGARSTLFPKPVQFSLLCWVIRLVSGYTTEGRDLDRSQNRSATACTSARTWSQTDFDAALFPHLFKNKQEVAIEMRVLSK